LITKHFGKGWCDTWNMKRTPKPCDVSQHKRTVNRSLCASINLKVVCFVFFLVLAMHPFTLTCDGFASWMAKIESCTFVHFDLVYSFTYYYYYYVFGTLNLKASEFRATTKVSFLGRLTNLFLNDGGWLMAGFKINYLSLRDRNSANWTQ